MRAFAPSAPYRGAYEAAVALNTLARLLEDRAEKACKAREARWEGLSDAATMARNAAGYSGLPQLPSIER
jgi:hypothetical protein